MNSLVITEILSSSLLTDKQITWATELYFFTYHKDKPFFDSVVRPYLENKRDKNFIDLWLLGRDLSSFISSFSCLSFTFDSFFVFFLLSVLVI